MNCSPLRGVRVEPLLPSLPASPMRMHDAMQHELDTSLDDEFALQQRHNHQANHEQAHEPRAKQPTLRELVDEPFNLSRQSSAAEDTAAAVDESEELVEECSRSACWLPMPTPTPTRCTPPVHHASHAQAVMHAHTLAAHSSPAMAAPQLVTPPTRAAAQRYATTAAVAASPLVDYRGTPIDTAPRRNLLEGQSDHSTEWSPFRAAAAASLSHTARHGSLLHSLASPSKSLHLHRLESQMASLVASPLRPHAEYDADASAENDQSQAVAMSHADAEASLMHVEQTRAEEADDAVEELGKHADDEDDEDDEEIDASRVAPQRWGSSPQYDRHSDSPAAEFSLARSPLSSQAASPFISPPVARVPEMRYAQPLRSSTPISASPFAATQPAATAPSNQQRASSPALAPDSQPWSSPMELSKVASKKLLQHSRYGQHAASEKKKRASLLATTALPKITPPTLDQWQREVDAKRTAAAVPMLRNKIQSNLTIIKSKTASKRATPAAPKSATATTAASANAVAPRSRPTAVPPPSSSSSSFSSSLTTLSRAPLAPLPLNSVVANPWSSAHEQAAEAEQPFHTPLKRTRAPVCHPPATDQPPAQMDRQRSPPPPTPVLHHLSPSLPPPAQPAQTYRAVVDGVHILPPALSWIAAHQIQPDRIRANLRYITTAYAHAD